MYPVIQAIDKRTAPNALSKLYDTSCDGTNTISQNVVIDLGLWWVWNWILAANRSI